MAPKADSTKKAAAPKAKSAHAPFLDMIKDAIANLKERNGSSRQAIKKYIKANNDLGSLSDAQFTSNINRALTRGSEGDSKVFERPKGPSGPVKLAKPSSTKAAAKTGDDKKAATKKSTGTKAASTKKIEAKKAASAEKKTSTTKKTAASSTAKTATKANASKPRAKKTADASAEKKPAANKTKAGRVTKTTKTAKAPAEKKAKAPAPKKAAATTKKPAAKKAAPKETKA